MTATRIIHHIFSQPDLRHVDQSELERLVETYPYFAAGRLLLAQKQFSAHQDLSTPAMKKAQLYSSSPQQLYQFLTAKEVIVTPEAAMGEAPVAHVPENSLPEAQPEESTLENTLDNALTVAQPENTPDDALPEAILEAPTPDDSLPEAQLENTLADALPEAQPEETAQHDLLPEAQLENTSDDALPEAQPEEPAQHDPLPEAQLENTSDDALPEEPVQENILNNTLPEAQLENTPDDAIPEAEASTQENTPDEPIQETPPEAHPATTPDEPKLEASIPLENIINPVKEETIVDAWLQEEHIVPPVIADEVTIVEEWQKEALDHKPDEISQKVVEEWHDEIVAIDYTPINEAKVVDEIIGEGKDEIVAIDYEPMNEAKAVDEIMGEGKDEIVAIDYEPINEMEAAEKADEIMGEGKDEIVAIDYGPINEKEAAEKASAYEPEIEEEEIILTADAEPASHLAAGLTLPGIAAEIQENTEAGPIRIHPMDTPVEETILTFQPLYTEDYFAYKKLKEPNNAEMMTERAQAEMRSFTDWLRELKDNFVAGGQPVRNKYQQQMHKLYEEEEPEVSEVVEKMAMDSITLTNDIVSETLAEIWVRQHQHAKAIAIYEKLSLLNPDKNAYFAQKIQELQLLTDNNK